MITSLAVETDSQGCITLTDLIVKQLWRYPVKSMAGNPVAALRFDNIGPEEDRRWMVVNADGEFLSQRRMPMLGQFRATLLGQTLTLHAPSGDQLTLTPQDCARQVTITVWSDKVSARSAPKAVNQWLSEQVGDTVFLVRYDAENPRVMDPGYAQGHVGFADGYPLLVCHQDSLDQLNSQAPISLEMERFRPNVVISGGQPWEENGWVELVNERHRLAMVKPCERCAVITLKPGTTERSPEVLKHLAAHSSRNGKPVFGQNAITLNPEAPLLLGEVLQARVNAPA